MKITKIITLTAVGTVAALQAFAATDTITASARFRTAISLTHSADINFTPNVGDYIDVLGTPGGGDYAKVGTNGSVTYTGTGFSGVSSGTAGHIVIHGDGASTMVIKCSASAIISDNATNENLLDLDQVKVRLNATSVYGTGDTACAGTAGGDPATLTPTSGTTDDLYIGARLVGTPNSGTIVNGSTYTTGGTNGAPITVSVVYQ